MNISNVKKLSKEHGEIFSRLQIHRERIANILEEPAVKGVKKSATDKYSEHAHFVYELLQNADDTKAKNVRFILDKKGLIFAHNGEIHFSISDPKTEEEDQKIGKLGHTNSIASIGNTAKKESQIGMFGFGFKAVFEYTNTPHVYDPPFLFKIDRFIIPVLLENDHPSRMDGETLFYFPFDLENKKDTAYKEINEKLKNLDNPLVFLRHLGKIEWQNAEGESGLYLRKNESNITALLTKINGNEFEHKFLMFERKVKDQDQFEHTINIAYKYDQEGENISSDHKFPAYCFSRTQKNTELRFIVHAPFLLTDSREGIKEDAWNNFLIKELAELVADSLLEIRKMRLLDVDFLNGLPIIKDDFKDSKFLPIYEAVLNKFKSDEKLLPANDGSHISAKQAFLARGEGLTNLLESGQLSQLFEIENCQWLDYSIPENSAVWNYLKDELKILIVRPETLVSKLKDEFIQEQSDGWMIKFYCFLLKPKELWEKSDSILRKKKFIRLSDNTHVTPFHENGNPQAYLPSDLPSSLPTIKQNIAKDENARKFLIELGLSEPDELYEILEFVLPKYSKSEITVSQKENIHDVKKICKLLTDYRSKNPSDSITKIKTLLRKIGLEDASNGISLNNESEKLVNPLMQIVLMRIPFLASINSVTKETKYKKSLEIYLPKSYTGNTELESFFEGNSGIWFLDECYLDVPEIEIVIKNLNILDRPKITKEEFEKEGKYKNYNKEGFKEDYKMDGLQFFLEKGRRNIETSLYLWKLLIDSQKLPNYKIEYKGSLKVSKTKSFTLKSTDAIPKTTIIFNLLTQNKWLPDKQGNFCKTSEIQLSDLPDEFEKESIEAKHLAEILGLGFKKNIEQEFYSQFPEEARLLELAKKISREKLEKLVTKEELGEKDVDETHDYEDVDYKKELEQTFNCPQIKEHEESHIPPDPIPDPTRRREKVQSDIQNSKDIEPKPLERVKRVPVKKWEQKNYEARTFLKGQYNGKCQICNYSFTKRDGDPYFEGVYLVSRTKAAWIDRPGNVLCLCANCSTKFMYGSVEANDILEQINGFKCVNEGGTKNTATIKLKLCNEGVDLKFTERHIVDLQEILKSSGKGIK
ncbi:MAG: hypothetical protein FJ264_15905 [Planctomycetes bacterium]|nr:hypothetical protein [Planctomycetota bacterium]